MSPSPQLVRTRSSRSVIAITGLISIVIAGLWLFPTFWYTRSEDRLGHFWLTEQTNVFGWTYREIPVSKAAETALVADRLLNGEYESTQGGVVRTFLAKRYAESANEIGLFAHTPDRCWTETGWRLEPTQPEFRMIQVHGIAIPFERRVFVAGMQRELVYFAGLVGGQPLPYRLDHNLAVGIKQALHLANDKTGTTLRAGDPLFWQRVWDAFIARRPLYGPKQFLRISTPITENGIEPADALIEEFLPLWLSAAPYQQELEAWGQRRLARP